MHKTRLDFQNILIINFGQMGDVILSLPALEAVRALFSTAKITVMTGKPAERIVRAAAIADKQITVDRVEMRDGNKLRSVADIGRLIRDIRRRRFDLVIDLHSLPETNLLAFVSGARRRLLANRESRSIDRLGNFHTKPPPEDKSKHLTDRYFDVLLPLGITETSREFNLVPDPAIESTVDLRMRENSVDTKVLLGFAIGAGNASRRWPLERFAKVARSFLQSDGLVPIVFLGPEETRLRGEVTDLFPNGTVIFDDLSLLELAAAASRLSAFVGNDSGPAHIAALADVPVVIVMDERAPLTYLPLGRKIRCVNHTTLDQIDAESVANAVKDSLQGR